MLQRMTATPPSPALGMTSPRPRHDHCSAAEQSQQPLISCSLRDPPIVVTVLHVSYTSSRNYPWFPSRAPLPDIKAGSVIQFYDATGTKYGRPGVVTHISRLYRSHVVFFVSMPNEHVYLAIPVTVACVSPEVANFYTDHIDLLPHLDVPHFLRAHSPAFRGCDPKSRGSLDTTQGL